MTPDDFVDESDLIDQVLEQIRVDVDAGDFTAIAELLKCVPEKDLIAYLPEGVYNA